MRCAVCSYLLHQIFGEFPLQRPFGAAPHPSRLSPCHLLLKEKEASYGHGKADSVEKMLPVYDNLERALNQETADAAYKKGVEMTMNELVKIFTSLGVEIFGNVGDEFDPNLHNAVMHVDNEELGENVIAQVFQKGFKIGEKVVRFAMVQVAN